MNIKLDSKIPEGPMADKWSNYVAGQKLVNPSNKRKFKVIVVGTGLAGASAAATLGELGYQVEAFTFHDSPRRAHSIAAQGGINAAKNYQGDGDSVHRLFYDTVKGGDFRAREANVHRLAEVSVNIIDQMVAQGVPFAREYGGLLDNRSFGGAQVSRTFYARGQTGQQLLIGAYQQLARQIGLGNVKLWNRTELVDVVNVDGRCAGIVTRDLINGELSSHSAHAVVLATGGYGNAFYLSTNAMACNVTAAWRAHRRGAAFANPSYTQIHPTCIPQADDFQSKLTLMSESLRNDGRIWVPKNPDEVRSAAQIPEDERDYYLERIYPSFGNLAPRDVSSRAAKRAVDNGQGVGPLKNGVYLDFAESIERLGAEVIKERYGNLFDMYERITGEIALRDADADLPGQPLHDGRPVGRLRAADHDPGICSAPARPTSPITAPTGSGASALMQGLSDGYFVLAVHDRPVPVRVGSTSRSPTRPTRRSKRGRGQEAASPRFQGIPRHRRHPAAPTHFHRELGRIIWDYCGMDRNRAGPRRRRSRRSRPCTRSSSKTCASRAPGTRPASTRPSRRSARSRRLLRARPVDVSRTRSPARRVVRRPLPLRAPGPTTAKRPNATTRTSPTSRRGNGAAMPPTPIEHREQLEYEVVQVRHPVVQGKAPDVSDNLSNITLKVWRQVRP